MDKRFKPLSPAEELYTRRALFAELEASPEFPIHEVVKKIRTTLRFTLAEYAR